MEGYIRVEVDPIENDSRLRVSCHLSNVSILGKVHIVSSVFNALEMDDMGLALLTFALQHREELFGRSPADEG